MTGTFQTLLAVLGSRMIMTPQQGFVSPTQTDAFMEILGHTGCATQTELPTKTLRTMCLLALPVPAPHTDETHPSSVDSSSLGLSICTISLSTSTPL